MMLNRSFDVLVKVTMNSGKVIGSGASSHSADRCGAINVGEHDNGKHVRFTTTGVSASMGYHLARELTVGAASAMVVMIAILATKRRAALLEYCGLIAADGDREHGFLVNFKKQF